MDSAPGRVGECELPVLPLDSLGLSDSSAGVIGVTVLFSPRAQEKRGVFWSGNCCSVQEAEEAVEMVWLVLKGQFRKT